MRYSLSSREVVADTVEMVTQAHCFDALVLIASCDKTVHGMFMASARLDLPAIVVTGGPMAAVEAVSAGLVKPGEVLVVRYEGPAGAA